MPWRESTRELHSIGWMSNNKARTNTIFTSCDVCVDFGVVVHEWRGEAGVAEGAAAAAAAACATPRARWRAAARGPGHVPPVSTGAD